MEQRTIPDAAPLETKITGRKMLDLLFATGEQVALDKLLKDLKKAQEQHPAAPGLTIAIAMAQRDMAEAQIRTTRIVLAAAAKAGLPIENHAIASELSDGYVLVKAIPGEPT